MKPIWSLVGNKVSVSNSLNARVPFKGKGGYWVKNSSFFFEHQVWDRHRVRYFIAIIYVKKGKQD